jgi:hypothetical protein
MTEKSSCVSTLQLACQTRGPNRARTVTCCYTDSSRPPQYLPGITGVLCATPHCYNPPALPHQKKLLIEWFIWKTTGIDFQLSICHSSFISLIKITNNMQLCSIIYYSIVPWLLYMFRAMLSLIIRSILTVITVSGFIHMHCCRLLSWLSRNYYLFMWMKPEDVITVNMLLMMSDYMV